MQSNATSFCSVQNSLGCDWRENCLLYCFFPSWKQTPALWFSGFCYKTFANQTNYNVFFRHLTLSIDIGSKWWNPLHVIRSCISELRIHYVDFISDFFKKKRNNINRTIYNTPQEKGFRVSNFSWTVAGLDQTFSGCDPPWSSWQERWCLDKIRRKYKTWK